MSAPLRFWFLTLLITIAWAVLPGEARAQVRPAEEAPAQTTRASALAAVEVEESAGLDASTVSTLRSMVAGRLRAAGVPTADPARWARARESAVTTDAARALTVGRLFSLRIGRLGSKLILGLEELSPEGLAPVASAELTAQTIEEADSVVPRLVAAVLERTAAAETASIATVTHQEAEPYRKRPSEKLFAIGLPLGLFAGSNRGAFGLSLAFMYETEHFRLGGTLLGVAGSGHGAGLLGISGVWLPLDRAWSPYLGAGVGYMTTRQSGREAGGGAGFTTEVGVEFFRLNGFRLMVGVEALLPTYQVARSSGSGDEWAPYFVLHPRIAF